MIEASETLPLVAKRRYPVHLVEYNRQQIETVKALEIPAKPDPDVLAIMRNLDLRYGRAKMLKALSFGLAVDVSVLLWCAGKPKACRTTLWRELQAIKGRHKWFRVIHRRLQLQITDQRALEIIRNAMRGGA